MPEPREAFDDLARRMEERSQQMTASQWSPTPGGNQGTTLVGSGFKNKLLTLAGEIAAVRTAPDMSEEERKKFDDVHSGILELVDTHFGLPTPDPGE